MDDASPRVVYNPEDNSIMVQTGGAAVTVDGLVGSLDFERISPEGESQLALWLDSAQADVLTKMIRHIIDKVPIRAESKQLLTDLLPEVEAVLARHDVG
ncbi:MAG: hypothetical protein AB7P40_03010 [Chloroflexota bacterium]